MLPSEYRTIDSSATSPSDYTASSGTIQFNSDEATRNITINIRNDDLVERLEEFFVQLITAETNEARVVIIDDDFDDTGSTGRGKL